MGGTATLPLCRGRYPPGAVAKWNHIEFRSVLTSPIFYCFTVSNVFQGLAFYLPGIYLALFANAIGVELDNDLARQSAEQVLKRGLQKNARIIHGDLLKQDYSTADLVTVYLLP